MSEKSKINSKSDHNRFLFIFLPSKLEMFQKNIFLKEGVKCQSSANLPLVLMCKCFIPSFEYQMKLEGYFFTFC